MPAPDRRLKLAVIAAVVVALGLLWRFAPRADPLPPVALTASSAIAEYGAERLLEGGLASPSPRGWRSRTDDAHPQLELALRARWPLSAVFLRGSAEQVELTVDGQATASPWASGSDRLWLFEQAREAQHLSLSMLRQAERVQPVFTGTSVLVLDGGAHASALMEILQAYGVSAALVPAIPEAIAKLVNSETRLIVGSAPLPEDVQKAVTAHLRGGGFVLESGPGSGLCAASTPETATLVNTHLQGPATREAIHFVGRLANEGACAACQSERVLLATESGDAVLRAFQMGGGRCLRMSANLVDVVMRLRQGDPARADQDSNGQGGVQPSDLFVGSMVPADYARPHADLLVEAVLAQLELSYRIHMLPPDARSVLVLTSDQDYVPDAALTAQAESTPAPLTFLLTDTEVGGPPDVDFGTNQIAQLTPATVEGLRSQGHEFGVHPNLLTLPASAYGKALQRHTQRFRASYGFGPRLIRNHHLVWSGYTRLAESEARVGLELNLDFMSLAFVGEGALGFLNGSGYPLRFLRTDGQVVGLFQQGTQLDDHVLLPARFGYEAHSVEQLIARSKRLIDQSVTDPPHPITVNHHPSWWFETRGAWQEALVAHARERGVAVLGAEAWLDHMKAVRSTLATNAGPRKVRVATAGTSVALLLPGAVRATVDGLPANSTGAFTLSGRRYTRIALPPQRDMLIEWSND